MKGALKYLLFFRNVVFLKWLSQIVFLVGFISIVLRYLGNASTNFASTNIAFSWDFLGETPGVSIAEGMYTLPVSGLQMLQVGMLNMLRITVTGIFAATILGTMLGIARLSKNYIVEKSATGILEIVRNVPLLVQILFFQALILTLPRLEVSEIGTYTIHASAKGIAFPWPNREPNAILFMVYFILVLYIANQIFKWRVRTLEKEGRETYPTLWAVISFVVLIIVGWYGGFRVVGIIGLIAGYLSMGLESVPGIFYQILFSAITVFIGFRVTKRFIDSKKSEEAQGIYSDDDYFKIIFNVAIVVLLVFLFLTSFGTSVSKFLVGDELTYKADWGLPQLFHGIENKLYWFPMHDVEIEKENVEMKKAEIINWVVEPGSRVEVGDKIADAYIIRKPNEEKIEYEIVAKYAGTIETLYLEEGKSLKVGEEFYEIQVTEGDPFTLSRPRIEQTGTTKFKRYSDDYGKKLSVGYFATWVGVVLYTAIFISEVVRAGIMAVAKGQSEAGLSLGFRRSALLRLIVIPQAIRVMLPPMGNQYLNLAKNTSLGIAVAFPEIVAVGQTLYNQEGQTLPVFIVWMIFYSTVSLTISSIINFYNRKLKIVER